MILPGDMGQSSEQFWVAATGHTIKGMFLDGWRANGAAAVWGNPVSEPFESPAGLYSQAFENGIAQYYDEYAYSNYPMVRLAPIGELLFDERSGSGWRRDGRRVGGGGDRRTSIWTKLGVDDAALKRLAGDDFFDDATGFAVTGRFATWWRGHAGDFQLGSPLSRAFEERGQRIQYFAQGALVERGGAVGLMPVGLAIAQRWGIDTTPVERAGMRAWNERLLLRDVEHLATGRLDVAGRKRIDVSRSQNTLRAFQGDEVVLTTLVSTGLAPNYTEIGRFHIRQKVKKQTMNGFTSRTGEVVSTGETPVENGSFYEVKDVPNVLYVNHEGEALHGAYWHNNFGRPMSHGCINLPLEFAEFMFAWTPVGTEIVVHD
jgi:lipoprotein-anchoring transpeptidase ErfK/SrfK